MSQSRGCRKVYIGLQCVVSNTMDVVVVKRRDCVIGSYTVLRTIPIAGRDINVADGCSGNHGRDNICQTTGNYNGDGATRRSERCEAGAAATVTSPATEAPTRTYAYAGTFESTPGFAAVFAIVRLILIFSIGRDWRKV